MAGSAGAGSQSLVPAFIQSCSFETLMGGLRSLISDNCQKIVI